MQEKRVAASTSPFKDISNYKTPRLFPSDAIPFPHSPLPIYFTAVNKTPSSSSSCFYSSSTLRGRTYGKSSKSSVARRLKELEIQQSKSARKVETTRKKSLQGLRRSLTAWLNFLFENPKACGCGIPIELHQNSSFQVVVDVDVCKFHSLRASMHEVCSIDDLRERMAAHLNQEHQIHIFNVMSHVTKNIDEGRLRMKAHCPLVTDVGLKEKAIRVLMSYNLEWLLTGLHMVFGGDSLLLMDDGNASEAELLPRMLIEKHLLSHLGLAKSFVYSKKVDGYYMTDYYEALGNVILKRFLLLVLLLDKAKCQSSLPLEHGIDGKDGGSSLLFSSLSHIKSSRQLIHEFLSEVMHGEGDLLAHLGAIGYKVTYQQLPLSEYIFTVTDFQNDLCDGVHLCRVVQLLQGDTSILMKLMIPADTRKKKLANCHIAIECLNENGIPLTDEDGFLITADDIVNGEEELSLSLLWNIFYHLQMPLVRKKGLLSEEAPRVKEKNDNQVSLHKIIDWIFQEFHQVSSKPIRLVELSKRDSSAIIIQSSCRCWIACQQYTRIKSAALLLQSCIRGSKARSGFAQMILLSTKKIASAHHQSAILIQKHCRGHSAMKKFLCQKNAAVKIQTTIRCINCQKKYEGYKDAAVAIQKIIRGQIVRTRFIGSSFSCFNSLSSHPLGQSMELRHVISAWRLQRWWKRFLLHKSRLNCAIIIQSHFRGWVARNETCKMKRSVIVIQRNWRLYMIRRKCQLIQLPDIEEWKQIRVIQDHDNIQCSMDIDKLVGALQQLEVLTSINAILQTSLMLAAQTDHSEKCCEILVAKGAIRILLKLIQSSNRSVPHQEVLKSLLSILRNFVEYPHLAKVLIRTEGAIRIVFLALLRNKETFFIAVSLLKKIVLMEEGVEEIKRFPSLIKRLQDHVRSLGKKAAMKRGVDMSAVAQESHWRWREATELLQFLYQCRT